MVRDYSLLAASQLCGFCGNSKDTIFVLINLITVLLLRRFTEWRAILFMIELVIARSHLLGLSGRLLLGSECRLEGRRFDFLLGHSVVGIKLIFAHLDLHLAPLGVGQRTVLRSGDLRLRDEMARVLLRWLS